MKAVVAAGALALVFALLGTPLFIRFLERRGYGQFIRDDGPTSHHTSAAPRRWAGPSSSAR